MTDLQDEAQAFNSALKEDIPSIGKPESLSVVLQRGLMDKVSGTWQTSAEVRELTGEDEEFLASLESDKSMTYAKYMNTLVAKATVRIGSIQVNGSQETIQELIASDRDILFLGIVKATYGPERTFNRMCDACGKQNDVTINLVDDFPITNPKVDIHAPLEVTLRKGQTIKMRLPTGADNIAIGKKGITTAEQSTLLIASCTIWDDGKGPDDPVKWAKSLSIGDRSKIVKALLSLELGPKMKEVNTQCAHCEETMSIVIDWVSLLLG